MVSYVERPLQALDRRVGPDVADEVDVVALADIRRVQIGAEAELDQWLI